MNRRDGGRGSSRPAPPLPRAQRAGVYAAILGRRDVRAFRPDPIPEAVLRRILAAAHGAGSVGFMQPWNFIVVRDRRTRERLRAHVERERLRAAAGWRGARRAKYLGFKLEGILDAPVNICVTCDRSRGGPAVIGRNTIRATDLYSTVCAVQNLWLAARAEGIGVGWVSILRPAFLKRLLGIPRGVVPVAYLCLGRVDRFARRPELETAGWRRRLPLDRLIFLDRWGWRYRSIADQTAAAGAAARGKR